MIAELYPQMRVGFPRKEPTRRRPQILDDRAGGAQRFDASEYEDTWAEDLWAEDAWAEDAWANDDNWVKRFMARLAGLIRSMGGRK
jgi:hypothetical protein